MKVGDLVGIGWSGIKKQPFPAIITKVHKKFSYQQSKSYTVYIFSNCKKAFATERDLKKIEDYLNI
tara:strand:- start:112 stop:309 length:198 start_codon:yes stop_codon:yes gene_type:complete